MSWQEAMEAAALGAAALAQLLVAALLAGRHRRKEWIWVLVTLFVFNGAVALVRATVLWWPLSGDVAGAAGGMDGLRRAAVDVMRNWLEPATAYLVLYLFLLYPQPVTLHVRHPWVLRGAVFALPLALWTWYVVARGSLVQGWGDIADPLRVLFFDLGPAAAWATVLVRAAWLAPHLRSPSIGRQAALMVGVFGLRAAHMGLASFLDWLHAAPSLGDAATLLRTGILAAPVAALGIATYRLAKARGPLPHDQARRVDLVLAALALGTLDAFLFGWGGLLPLTGWANLLTHYEVYVLRPVIVWLAIAQDRFTADSRPIGAGGLYALGALTWSAGVAAFVPAASHAFDNLVAAWLLGILAGSGAAAAVILLGTERLEGRRSGSRTPAASQVDPYLAALEEAWADGPPSPAEAARVERLRRHLGISGEQHDALLRAVRAGWREPVAEWQPGSLVLARYEIIAPLGQGTTGRAYRASDILARNDVVLKRITGLDPGARKAFLTEAEALRRARSENVVGYVRVERMRGDLVLVLEYMPGGSLADRLHDGPLPWEQVRRIALETLAGLEHVHAQGLVHRDIKPANVLLGADGRAVLADFGAATASTQGRLDAATRITPAGSPAYMAPEVRRGLPADERSDLFSLGLTLLEAGTGVRPDPAAPTAVAAMCPAAWRHFFASVLASAPARRPGSAVQMRAALPATSGKAGGSARRPRHRRTQGSAFPPSAAPPN